MDYTTMNIDDIIKYCQEQGPEAVAWLKETAAKKVEYKIYPRIKVDGKSVADKSQEPKIELRPISFVQLKTAFCEKFGLGMPKAPKAPSMYDKIAAL
jgi:hypothetical protein